MPTCLQSGLPIFRVGYRQSPLEKLLFGGSMKKVLFVASTEIHIRHFHLPYIECFKKLGWQVHVACKCSSESVPEVDKLINLPFEKKMSSLSNFKATALLREQIKKNNYDIQIHTIGRVNNYNDDSLNYDNVSAKAIRNGLKKSKDISEYTPMIFEDELFYLDEYFDLLKYKILTMSAEELKNIHLMEEGIENLFKKKIVDAHNMEEFINSCVSKRYTFARIKRTIVHIILNTKKNFAKDMLNEDIKYIRLLGIDKKGSEYLKEKRKEIEIPVLSKFRGNSFALLQYEKQATYAYASVKSETLRSKLYEEEHFFFPIRKY